MCTEGSILTVFSSVLSIKDGASILLKAFNAAQDHRIKLFLSRISIELVDRQKINNSTLKELVSQDHERFRSWILGYTSKVLQCETELAVRMLAVLAATEMGRSERLDASDRLLFRGLHLLYDDEIELACELVRLYDSGKIEFNSEADEKDSIIAPSKQLLDSLNPAHSNNYMFKVEALKRAAVAEDVPHGFLDSAGGWGYLKMGEVIKRMAEIRGMVDEYADPEFSDSIRE